jgi:sulfur-carrier protein adenylyltransferase/sulfurtransferase
MRSRAAASMLQTAGFATARSMLGGLRAWEGLTSPGQPEAGVAFFTLAARADELIALAWLLEEGSRRFYEEAQRSLADSDVQTSLSGLVSAEEHHKASLENLYQTLTGSLPGKDFPSSLLPAETPGDHMEGGVRVSEALTWIKGKSIQDFLELAMSLETASYDLYIKMERRIVGENSKKVFSVLSGEEKKHVESLASLLDRKM